MYRTKHNKNVLNVIVFQNVTMHQCEDVSLKSSMDSWVYGALDNENRFHETENGFLELPNCSVV